MALDHQNFKTDMHLNIQSETGQINGVIVHTPGREVSLVHPDYKHELLFDDIIFESDAREEHLEMLRIFKTAMPDDGQIFEIVDLILEVFQQNDARSYFIESLIIRQPELRIKPFDKELLRLDAQALAQFAVLGQTGLIPELTLLPSPNLLFTRDLAAVVGKSIVLSRAAKKARIRESILMETLVRYHPLFSKVKDHAIRIPDQDSIEGGDILVASGNLVLIGMSERTSFSGVMTAGSLILAQGVENVLIVDIPKQRSSMHLDTIFTFASQNECVVFPPAIINKSDNVVLLTKKGKSLNTRLMPSLKQALEEILEREFTFIKCGGDEKLDQYREQWSDGANLFCLAPGVVVGYERNTSTYNTMADHGYEIITQAAFLDRYSNKPFLPDSNKKMAITFIGNELCRGRGGARCMTLPISRVEN